MKGDICRVDGCERLVTVHRGALCTTHRTRYQRHKTFVPSQKALNRYQGVLLKNGYVRINKSGKRVLEHNWLMEQKIGRKLTKDECVHHINGVKNDNRQENLKLMTKREHQIFHQTGKTGRHYHIKVISLH